MKFEHRNVVDRVDVAELLRKVQSVRLRANLSNNAVRTERLLGKLRGRAGSPEELRFNEHLVTNFNFRWRSPACVSRSLITSLRLGNLLPQLGLQLFQVHDEISGLGRGKVAFRVDCEVRVVTLVREEWGNPRSRARGVVVREFRERKQFRPVVLLVIAVHPKILFQSLVSTLGLPIRFRMVSGSEVQPHV